MTDLFENFQGADIDRLTDCMKAVREAGLTMDRHTMAGINSNSGHVWIANEAWIGCVACSIGFDVFWVWSCGNCGEEYEFKTYSELEEFVQDQEDKTNFEGCTACVEVTA